MTSRAYFGRYVSDLPLEILYKGQLVLKYKRDGILFNTIHTTSVHSGPAIGKVLTSVPTGISTGYGRCFDGEIHEGVSKRPIDPDGSILPPNKLMTINIALSSF